MTFSKKSAICVSGRSGLTCSIIEFLEIDNRHGLEGVEFLLMSREYSIVKDSSADLEVNSKIVQIRPTVKAVST